MRRLAFLIGMMMAAAAEGAPQSIADCEKIEAPHAYNQCLASFGPTRGGGGGAGGAYTAPAAEPARKSHGAMMPQRPARIGVLNVTRTRAGRVRMEFTPGGK
jgi:hypothetical protein